MTTNTILQGDALEKLKEILSESIDCIMTSPPYWSLRDYGTAIWEGGDKDICNCGHDLSDHTHVDNSVQECSIEGCLCEEFDECNHKVGRETRGGFSEFQKGNVGSFGDEAIKTNQSCPKCGAIRRDKQLGLEPTFKEYINKLCDIFDECKRVLKKTGTCWINLGDTYSSGNRGEEKSDSLSKNKLKKGETLPIGFSPPNRNNCGISDKSLCLIPFRFALEMQNRGWILRNVIIWHKPNCMPSSVKDRFTVDFEYLFFFVKSKKYYFETQYEKTKEPYSDKIAKRPMTSHGKEPTPKGSPNNLTYNKLSPLGRNKRAVWSICPKPYSEAHFATYPEELCETPIKAGCPIDGLVLDPFFGAGTTGLVALKQDKKFIGIELNPEYIKIANKRLKPYLEQTKLNEDKKQ